MAGLAEIAGFECVRQGADIAVAAHYECCIQRNFSRNRPEVTNLNHQFAIRRVLICLILTGRGRLTGGRGLAQPQAYACDLLHNCPWKHGCAR